MKFARTLTAVAALAAAGAIGGAASAQDAMSEDSMASEAPMVGGAPMLPSRTIVENASQASNLTTLVAAVKQAGLVETLSGEGPFTVFAPTNSAFADLPEGSVERLMMPENKDRLAEILTCHVVPANAMADTIVGMVQDDGGTHTVETVGGCNLDVTVENGTVMIEDGQGRTAQVIVPDVVQSNGVVHAIDKVLLPAVDG